MADDEVYQLLNPDDVRVILSYANNDMRLSGAARDTFYARNTYEYALDRIYRKTKLNPRSFYDLVKLVRAIANAGHS